MKEIEALLFDFGGVIIEIDFDRVFARWAQLAGAPFEQVKRRFSHGEAYQRHERGEIGLAAYFASLRRDLGIDLGDEEFADGWARVFGPEYPSTVQLLKRLEPRVPMYLFSNTHPTHYELWSRRHEEALRPLRKRFISCEMGVRKPEAESFRRVAAGIGVPLERILFFDDTQANLDAAEALGVKTVLVRSPEDVARAVRPWL
jgi:putative hydrolase of the HAD superfamily